ncbi:hypothetical protein A3J17_04735 [Candidatus Curtissbacteria bacterium RIFCSPLOWO2_02_FULL_40_11]|uniref:D-glycerate dehydrogenase n=1 Tax=Candidatus Curtissbacteria bacterium RIFCSPHIGHO2_02_FULL_40_16b TaxID=1797714 RepID=A0A1F5G833_9BACT|nr:MAG: hypothetical protein A3D04_03020 [Candidatus Curtissbacteria bacterium RIFCSPHIGHO2_02_FULL_40_16b]OGD99689.1 MAG: hypothetical protein A3J17_04735 [Candidatus Curtissbacteria bacterium RIFCSPLOWO2_02_FULL_40_11]
MPKVYVAGKIQDNGIELLKRKGFKVDLNLTDKDLTREELKDIFSKYDAVITMPTDNVDSDLLSSASKNLKVIANYAVGYDNIDERAAKKSDIVVCNTPGVANEAVAEHTFAMIFALNKQLKVADRFVREGNFKQWDPNAFLSHQLWGQTIGIIGLGRIGTFVGQIAFGGFKMHILYFDIARSEDFELLCEAEYTDMRSVLSLSDIVTLHVPLTTDTRGMISTEELKLMKKTALLINTSRGPVIDEKALIWALKEKEIAGAGLDVYEHEPEVSAELIKMSNVILTPHTASATIETRERMSELVAQNIIDVFEGREPVGLVN